MSGTVGGLNGAAGVGGAGVSLAPTLSALRLSASLIAPAPAPQVVPVVFSAQALSSIAPLPPLQTPSPEGTARSPQAQGESASDPDSTAESSALQAAQLFDGVPGANRRAAWTLDGRRAEYLDGGGFKDVLIHPDSQDHLVTLFNQAGAFKPGGSRSERDRETRHRAPLAAGWRRRSCAWAPCGSASARSPWPI